MDRITNSTLCIARIILEAGSALSISTGNADGIFDTALVRDANGLPAIPGTSLAGVLRHLWIDRYGKDNESLFGYQKHRENEGESSRLTVSWGALLDSEGNPSEGLLTRKGNGRLEDELYRAVLEQADTPVLRDRVRLTHRGAASASDRGKYDRSVLPAGHRFAVELRMWRGRDGENEEWDRLLALLNHPAFRLGGATRAGLGRMKTIRLFQRCFDLTNRDDVEAFCRLKPGLHETEALEKWDQKNFDDDHILCGTLEIEAKGLWRIGQGNESLSVGMSKPADLLPKIEERIDWSEGRGKRELKMLLLPASSVKGALAHRMAFHARCLAGEWNGREALADDRPQAVDALFGSVKERRRGDGETKSEGRAGALFIDDAVLSTDATKVARLMHNAIDRFTGGVRDRMLFEEESVWKGKFKIPLVLNLNRIPEDRREQVRRAFKAALDDLCQGRLALGSRTTTGNGFFEGTLTGPLADWLTGKNKESAA